jgi:adenine phosphoribosyltransferase
MQLSDRLRANVRVVEDFPKPGISFKDISPLFLDPKLVGEVVKAITERFGPAQIDKVVGAESRGFLLGPMIAQRLDAGFVMVRKEGKLPHATQEVTYDLEYGSATLEVHTDALQAGDRVLIHDDLLATGGSAAATAHLAQMHEATVAGFSFLLELAFLPGRDKLSRYGAPVHALLQYQE